MVRLGSNRRVEAIEVLIVSYRARFVYAISAMATIAIGLLVHFGGEQIGARERDVIGDALWAAMMVWWVSAMAPRAKLVTRTAVAYLICVGVEVTQLYHSAAVDAVRGTRVGHLVLGSGFDPRDLVAYAIGVATALLLELAACAVTRSGRERVH